MSRPCVIAGASGLVGGFCLRELLDSPEFAPVISLGRRKLDLSHAKLDQRTVDLAAVYELGDLNGGAVFCALGTTIAKAGSKEAFRKVDYEYPLRLAQTARRSGASSFVLVSSVGADASSRNFYLSVKGSLEQQLYALGFPSLHIFQPSFLMGHRPESRLGERVGIAIARPLAFLLAGPLRKYRPVDARDVAHAMVHAVRHEALGTRVYQWPYIMGCR
jgi:uncharacterized protein YbjT (DUF2867 family)